MVTSADTFVRDGDTGTGGGGKGVQNVFSPKLILFMKILRSKGY